MPVLDAVYPEYFGQVPSDIKKGSTKVKAIFKGQYQVYPPIKTLTLTNFTPVNYNIKFFLVKVTYSSGTITLTFNQANCPTFYFNYETSQWVGGTYDGYTRYDTVQKAISMGAFTQTSFTVTNYDGAYGISTSTTDKNIQRKKIVFTSGGTKIVISTNAKELYDGSESMGGTVYTWDVEEYKSSTQLNSSLNAFSFFKETNRSTSGVTTGGKKETGPQAQMTVSDYAYVKSGKLYLYSAYLPTVPYNGFLIENFGSTNALTLANCGAYSMAYFYQLSAPTLPDYYAHLTGNRNTVNLYDYGVTASQTTTYRYDITPQALPNYVFKANLTTNYVWNYTGSTLTFIITRTGDPFYLLDFYVTPYTTGIYVELTKQVGADKDREYVKGVVSSTGTTSRNVTFSQTWNLTDNANKATQWGAATVNTGSYPLTRRGNYSSTKFTTASRTYTIYINEYSSIITSSSSSYPVKAGAGIDWFWTWWWAHGGDAQREVLRNYLNRMYPTLTASTTCTLYVYALCWEGFIGKAYHNITFKYVGAITLKTTVNTNLAGLEWRY